VFLANHAQDSRKAAYLLAILISNAELTGKIRGEPRFAANLPDLSSLGDLVPKWSTINRGNTGEILPDKVHRAGEGTAST
jgi:hypothetical protein